MDGARLIRALQILEALRSIKDEAYEFHKAFDLAFEDAKSAARVFTGDTMRDSPDAKRVPPRGGGPE